MNDDSYEPYETCGCFCHDKKDDDTEVESDIEVRHGHCNEGVDLEHFQKVLPFELFKAYVHTMGSVEGLGIEPRYTYKGKD